VTAIRIYFEGSPRLKPGFHAFLKELVLACRERRREIRFIDGGSQNDAVADFKTGLKANPEDTCVLLIDSDGPDSGNGFLPVCQRWHIPVDRVFWMVQVMESWFLADPQRLSEFYGPQFNSEPLKTRTEVETIPKSDVLAILRRVNYHKTKDAPKLLEIIRPDLVKAKSAHCRRLFERVSALLLQP
jgi:hypothetical protein